MCVCVCVCVICVCMCVCVCVSVCLSVCSGYDFWTTKARYIILQKKPDYI